jgi:hypothetical protein
MKQLIEQFNYKYNVYLSPMDVGEGWFHPIWSCSICDGFEYKYWLNIWLTYE